LRGGHRAGESRAAALGGFWLFERSHVIIVTGDVNGGNTPALEVDYILLTDKRSLSLYEYNKTIINIYLYCISASPTLRPT
jgi:hypothetical protein